LWEVLADGEQWLVGESGDGEAQAVAGVEVGGVVASAEA